MAGSIGDALGNASGAVGSLFAGFSAGAKADMFRIESKADLLKGKGDLLEADSYDKAQALALQNEKFTEQSTAIQQAQSDRSIYQATGAIRANVGASGLQMSGSATDVLADSARQGELQKQVLGYQGLMTEAGYTEQAETYANMSGAAHIASDAETLASEEHLKAASAEDTAATGDFIQSAIKGVAAVASIAAAPFTGGLSLAALPAVAGSMSNQQAQQ